MNFIKKKEGVFLIGNASLILSVFLSIFAVDFLLLNFFKGLFTGISVVMNLGYLLKLRMEKNQI